MELLAPWSLAGLVIVPAIFLWGLLAPRGRPIVVGSLMLWRRALGKGAAGKPSARVRLRDPLLWLDAAAVLLVVLACAQPAVRTAVPSDPVATVILDRTASMGIGPSAEPRWLRARGMLLTAWAAIGAVPVRIVHVPDEQGAVFVEQGPAGFSDHRSVSSWVSVLAERDVWPTVLAEAAARPDLPVLVMTDIAPTVEVPRNVYVLAPGGESKNVGLVRAAARIEPDRWWLLVSARWAAGATEPCEVQVDGDGQALARGPPLLSPGEASERVLEMPGPPPRELAVRLHASADGFEADNVAYLALEPAGRIRVLLVGAADPALGRALAACEGTTVVESPAGASVPTGETDLVVACGSALPADWRGPAAVILPPAAVGPVRPAEGQGPAAWRVARDHPLAEALYLEPPRIAAARRYAIDDSAQVLVGTRDAPLAVTWEEGGARRLAVLFAFDEQTTDWPRRAGFPVFWSRATDWLVPKDRRAADLRTHLPLEPMPGRGRLAPGQAGFHDDRAGRFGVSFIGSEEGFQAGPGRDDSQAAAEAIRRAAEALRRQTLVAAWPWLAAAVLAVLAVRAWMAK